MRFFYISYNPAAKPHMIATADVCLATEKSRTRFEYHLQIFEKELIKENEYREHDEEQK